MSDTSHSPHAHFAHIGRVRSGWAVEFVGQAAELAPRLRAYHLVPLRERLEQLAGLGADIGGSGTVTLYDLVAAYHFERATKRLLVTELRVLLRAS
jgi:hypothetical protein